MRFKANAKWILSGEHAVIRGAKAIAFPATNYEMALYVEINKAHRIAYPDMPEKFKENFEQIISFLNKKFNIDILDKYSLKIESNIPVSCGFGSSAALAVLFSKFISKIYKTAEDISLAIEIENLLHGKSSGLDVYAIYYNKPIIFQIVDNQCLYEFIKLGFMPKFEISIVDTEKTTQECISIVNDLIEFDSSYATVLDSHMNIATHKCIEGLEKNNINILADGINLAAKCFDSWGLITPKMQSKILEYYKNGAIACKPIGSGGGGGILALYK